MAEMPEYRHQKIDAIVTLGLQLEDDGTPKPELLDRIATAARLFGELSVDGPAPMMIMSGNRWVAGANIALPSEAEVMKERAIGLGVPEANILKEEQSLNTFGNILFSKKIIEQHGWRRLALVSSGFHLKACAPALYHIMGPDYDVTEVPSADPTSFLARARYEKLAGKAVRAIVESTNPGDDAAIWAKLCELTPEYLSLVAGPEPALEPRSLGLGWLGHGILPQAA